MTTSSTNGAETAAARGGMHRGVAIAWADALESGEYEQTSSALRHVQLNADGERTYEYCCLGVLCDIAPVGEWANDTSSNYIGPDGEVSSSFPTVQVSKWARVAHKQHDSTNVTLFDQCDGSCNNERYPLVATASHMNDCHHWSFKQIAHAIRQRYAADTLPPTSEPDGSQRSALDTLPVESGVQ